MPSNQVFHTFHIFPIIQCLYQYTLEEAIECANGEDDKKQKDHILILSNSLLLHFFVLPSEHSYFLLGNLVCRPYKDGTSIHDSLNSRNLTEGASGHSHIKCFPAVLSLSFPFFFHIPKQPNISY